ncbi:MAG: response regulator, partial [Syntrophobacteraceae bacterium]|nr:response regulator [Syntrophobacteraceae bacterium]
MGVTELDILIVEDEPFQREMLRDHLLREGHRVQEAGDGDQAMALLKANTFDLLLLDYRMSGMNGLEVLKEAKGLCPDVEAILITAYGAVETAVEAMKAGAVDYLTKPIDLDELSLLIERIARQRTLIRENDLLRQALGARGVSTDAIRFKSRRMAELVQLAGRVASSQATVLIQGETGTGKELMARLVHQLSPRAHRPL